MDRRKSTRVVPSRSGNNANANTTNTAEQNVQPSHRTADQPKGVLRSTASATTTSQPANVQTTGFFARRAIQLIPKEFDALIGLRRMQLGLDSHETRARELARLETEDPVGYYYAQTPAERALHALQAAGVLFEMGGGDIVEPVAALSLMKLRREEERAKRVKAGSVLLAGFRAAKAKEEAGEAAETVTERVDEGKGKKRALPAEEGAGGEPPKKSKSVRFGGEE